MSNNKSFYLYFNEPFYKKNDILITSNGYKVKIIKVYKDTWYRRLLNKWFNKPFRSMNNCVKVKPIE